MARFFLVDTSVVLFLCAVLLMFLLSGCSWGLGCALVVWLVGVGASWGFSFCDRTAPCFLISSVTMGDKYMDIYSWKTLSNKSRLKDLCFKRRIITVCNGTKRGFHFGTEVGW